MDDNTNAYEQTISDIHAAIRVLQAKVANGMLPPVALDAYVRAAQMRTDWTEVPA